MPEYDPAIIKEYSKRLYSQAQSTKMRHFFIGMFLGIVVFGVITDTLLGTYDALIVSIGAFIGAVMGLGSGQNRAFELQMQAQQVLCLARIEEDIRKN